MESEMAASFEVLTDWWAELPQPERRLLLSDAFPVEFAYNSGRIENESVTFHDTAEIFKNGKVSSYTGDLRTLFEIENQRRAWEKALTFSESGSTLDMETLLEFHRVLTSGTYDEARWAKGERPGTFKKGEYVVGVAEVGYPPEDVPLAVDELVNEVAGGLAGRWGADPAKVMRVSCYFHAALVDIHPFADGNGRTARLVQNALLMSRGLPPTSVLESDRAAYYGALDAFHLDDSLDPFEEFCVAESLQVWSKAMGVEPPRRVPSLEESLAAVTALAPRTSGSYRGL